MKRQIICKGCGKLKENYAKGLCSECYSKKNLKKWRKDNPERAKAQSRKWKEENPEKIKKARKKCYDKNKEKYKKYYLENKEKIKARIGKWQRNNPEKRREFKLKRRGYDNPKKGVVNRIVNENIFKYGIITCEKCKKECRDNYNVDHIIPVSKNGTNECKNLQILCAHCNQVKYINIADYRNKIKNNQLYLGGEI